MDASKTMTLGITGHQRLPEARLWAWVTATLERILIASDVDTVGLSSLAAGADQLFGELVLKHHRLLHVVIPFPGYERTFASKSDLDRYQTILSGADQVRVLPARGTDEQGFFEAGKEVVRQSNIILAVWNGKPAAGLGGTADIVSYARQTGVPVVHLNPLEAHLSLIADDSRSRADARDLAAAALT